MFGINSHTPVGSCGIIIDIGSGSVGTAIVSTSTTDEKPAIIWSHREYTLIKDVDTTKVPFKEISTALINIFLQLSNQGLKILKKNHPHLHVTAVQVTISAPWAYTIKKTIHFSDEQQFEIDEKLIEDLSHTAKKRAMAAVLENNILNENQLEIINNKAAGITVNGYPVKNPYNLKTKELSLVHITAITQRKILTILNDSINRLFPKASITTMSFMLLYYKVLMCKNPKVTEACLIDVTSEATEIGIIREGILTHVTNISFGTFSLAREIAMLCGVPKEEAYTYIKGGASFLETKLSEAKKAELQIILDAYEDKIAHLFKTTGDKLAIPKTLFLHCDTTTEDFFVKHLTKAAKKATSIEHSVYPITTMLFEESKSSDIALLLSAYYYKQTHK